MRIILIAVIAYLVIRYLLRPILMAVIVKSAGKMMQDMQNRQQGGPINPGKPADTTPPKKTNKEVPGEYIDYEEVK
ncbi:MAG: hypothetical protein JWM14_479 [Chitinophagaceae bacterium]|nr:hypothetical protein [Chitinophagaceae bacterium]